MIFWLLKRFSSALPTLFCIVVLAWILSKNLPGDAAERWVSAHISPSLSGLEIKKSIEQKRIEFGLNLPLFFFSIEPYNPNGWQKLIPFIKWNGTNNQFAKDMYKLISLKWGRSVQDNRYVSQKISTNLKYTTLIVLPAYLISFFIAIPIGLSLNNKLNKNASWRNIVLRICFFFIATPSYLLSIFLILFLANPNILYLFPEGGIKPVGLLNPTILDSFPFVVLPMLSIILPLSSFFIILLKDYSEQESNKLYITTAKSKGLSTKTILRKHLFPNSLAPIITSAGVLLPTLLSGSIIIERIFNIPGMGSEMLQACFTSDYPMVIVLFSLYGFLTIFGVILSDFFIILTNPQLSFKN